MPDISVSPKVDPITKILTKQSPSIQDVGKALLRSSTGKTTYGEALNTIKAKQLNEAKLQYNIQTQERQLKQADRRQDFAEKKFQMEHGLSVAKQQHRGFHDIWKDVTKEMSLADQSKLWDWAQSPGAGTVDKGDMRGNLYRGIARLGIKKAPAPTKPTLAEKKKKSLIGQGYNEYEAEGLAFGYLKLTTDPVTGDSYVVDMRSGSKTPTSVGDRSAIPKKVKINLSAQNTEISKLLSRLPDMEAAITIAGGGLVGGAADLRSKLGGQLPDALEKQIATDEVMSIVEARRTIELFREDMRKALSANPRMSLQEQQRILAILPSTELLSSSPDNLAALKSTQKRLQAILNDNNVVLGKTPGFQGTKENPYKPTTQDAYSKMPPGSFFINPSDGRMKRKP